MRCDCFSGCNCDRRDMDKVQDELHGAVMVFDWNMMRMSALQNIKRLAMFVLASVISCHQTQGDVRLSNKHPT